MHFCVCIKQVPDVSAPSRIEAGKLTQDTDRLVLNAYDASALEECLVMRDAVGGDVSVVCVGGEVAKETIRKALAMGADSGTLLVADEEKRLDSFAYADILATYLKGHPADLVACGKQAQDTDAGLTGSMLAELLDLPYASNAVGLETEADGSAVHVVRQSDSGQERIDLPVPSLVTCSNDMNEPRIPTLKGIMQSKRKPIEEIDLETLGLAERYGDGYEPNTELIAFLEPEERALATMLEGEPEEMATEACRLIDRQTSLI